MINTPSLAALIGSRICHDLISPIGAIGNEVELLMLDRASASPELALIAESVANASARIRFFRIAYGSAAGERRIAGNEAAGILADMTDAGRLKIDWQSPPELSRCEVKLAFLLLQCLESAMPYGGAISIRCDGSAWRISAEAERLRLVPELWRMLSEPPASPDIPAAQVHFALVPDELRRQGRRLVTSLADNRIDLIF